MQKTDSIKNVMTALGAFQSEAIKITKDSTNPHFKSKYASLAAILDEIQPILTKCKLVFTQVPEENTHLITMLFHTESGEYIESRYSLTTSNATPQGIGSAITYARRYSLTALLGLNIDDDDDGNLGSAQPKDNNKQPQQQASVQQAAQPQPQQQTQQPQAPITPYNKKYTDINAMLAVIKSVMKVDELSQLYFTNQQFSEDNKIIKDAISARRDAINNHGKVIPTDGQINQVCVRISKGDAKAYDGAVAAFILNHNQTKALQNALTQYKQLEEALKLKYSQPADIINIINMCITTEHVTRLHSNNAMIIDRDPELTNKINGKLRTLKQAV